MQTKQHSILNSEQRLLLCKEFQSHPKQLLELRKAIRHCLKKTGVSQDFMERMTLAVNEAAMNIIQHSYAGRETEKFTIEVYSDDKALTFCLIDSAPEIDEQCLKPRCLKDIRPGGLGLHFINELMDEVIYLDVPDNNNGNILQMKKQLEK